MYLLNCLGFIINEKKSVLEPTQSLDFLGLSVDTVTMELRLPGDKMKSIRAEARKLVREELVSARALSRLLGKMNATTLVIPPAPLFFRQLQRVLSETLNQNAQDYDGPLCGNARRN